MISTYTRYYILTRTILFTIQRIKLQKKEPIIINDFLDYGGEIEV